MTATPKGWVARNAWPIISVILAAVAVIAGVGAPHGRRALAHGLAADQQQRRHHGRVAAAAEGERDVTTELGHTGRRWREEVQVGLLGGRRQWQRHDGGHGQAEKCRGSSHGSPSRVG